MELFTLKVNEGFKNKTTGSKIENLRKKKKCSTNFLSCYAICRHCNSKGLRYEFVLENKPDQSELFVKIKVKRKGEHNHEKKAQIRDKEEREKIAQDIKYYGGSTEAYLDNRISEEDLYSNMMFIATNQYLETAQTSKVINGFVRELTIFSEFSFVIHLEEQIKAIELILPEYRILNLDATGSLVRIVVRSIGLERSQSLIVSEMVSSRQDSLQLERFYRLIRNDYCLVFPSKSLKFRFIVCHFSWAEIRASLRAFNNDTVLDYSNRIFDVKSVIF
ncbi:unnamed protein product [Brachionus calyciflorus]|uniref:Uncharacterized protein n=1 Tax=Brachionus calyciflorus TaxID=104777 RepID=A0A814AB29_9BILA|nr:unnamed protein product [Brachionus calyciflorus]